MVVARLALERVADDALELERLLLLLGFFRRSSSLSSLSSPFWSCPLEPDSLRRVAGGTVADEASWISDLPASSLEGELKPAGARAPVSNSEEAEGEALSSQCLALFCLLGVVESSVDRSGGENALDPEAAAPAADAADDDVEEDDTVADFLVFRGGIEKSKLAAQRRQRQKIQTNIVLYVSFRNDLWLTNLARYSSYTNQASN